MNLTPEQIQTNQTAVRAAGDRTIEQYQNWMQTNGAAHLMRAARQVGILGQLREKQHTLAELCDALSLDPVTTQLLVDGLVSIGIVEQYEDDLALARAGHLLCTYDEDLGDNCWNQLASQLPAETPNANSNGAPKVDVSHYRAQIAATQWIHTAAAMQAAEILDIGGSGSPDGPRILDLGCGSAVWSCAMAHRDAASTVVAIDNAAALEAAKSTAKSIDLGDQFKSIEGDPATATLGSDGYDIAILAELLSCYDDATAKDLLGKAVAAVKTGGRVVIPDYFVGPGRAGLKETLNRLRIHLSTAGGTVRDLRTVQQMLLDANLGSIQFTYLAASEAGLGMVVATKSSE